MKNRKIIIDCDPGHDDALAILWALSSDQLEVLGITTVAGNQTIDKVTLNTLKVLTIAERYDVPVAKGSSEPLLRDLAIGGEVVHGDSGLEGPILPDPKFETSDLSATELLIKLLDEANEKITLVPLGPLTNIALLFKLRPDLKEKIDVISLMGGGTIGNFTPAAEYNIWADPEAAHIVFNSGINIIMSGLDVTQKAYMTKDDNEVLRSKGGKITVFAAELIDYFSKFHYEVEGFPGCTLHDPTSIAALIYPDLFTSIDCNVDVELHGELTKGMTVVDFMHYNDKIFGKETPRTTKFLNGVNREEYVSRFIDDLTRLDNTVK